MIGLFPKYLPKKKKKKEEEDDEEDETDIENYELKSGTELDSMEKYQDENANLKSQLTKIACQKYQ